MFGRNRNQLAPPPPEEAPRRIVANITKLLLCGTSSYAMYATNPNQHPIAFGVYTLLCGNSLLGLLREDFWCIRKASDKIYDASQLLSKCLPLPFLNTQLYMLYDGNPRVAIVHAASIVTPLIFDSCYSYFDNTAYDVISMGNIASASICATIHNNYWLLGLSCMVSLQNAIMNCMDREATFVGFSREDLGRIVLSACCACAVLTLNAVKDA